MRLTSVSKTLSYMEDEYVHPHTSKITTLHLYAHPKTIHKAEFAMTALKMTMSWYHKNFVQEQYSRYDLFLTSAKQSVSQSEHPHMSISEEYLLSIPDNTNDHAYTRISATITGKFLQTQSYNYSILNTNLIDYLTLIFISNAIGYAETRIKLIKLIRSSHMQHTVLHVLQLIYCEIGRANFMHSTMECIKTPTAQQQNLEFYNYFFSVSHSCRLKNIILQDPTENYDGDQDVLLWQTWQRIFTNCIQELLHMAAEHRFIEFPVSLVEMITEILHSPNIEDGIKAEILTLPGKSYIASKCDKIDVELLAEIYDEFEKFLAHALHKEFYKTFESLSGHDTTGYEPKSIGTRKLQHLCLQVMVKANLCEYIELCCEVFYNSNCTQNKQNALEVLRTNKYYNSRQIQDKALATVDLWLKSICGFYELTRQYLLSDQESAIRKIECLKHFAHNDPMAKFCLFEIVNVFTQETFDLFHDRSGKGYKLIADMIIMFNNRLEIDQACLLLNKFSNWTRFDCQRKQLILTQMRRLTEHEQISVRILDQVEIIINQGRVAAAPSRVGSLNIS